MDEPPYKEIDSDQLSSMLLRPKKIVIGWQGAINNKQPPMLCQGDKFYFWADAYDEEANIMDEVGVFWECTPPEAATLLPIDHLVAIGCQAAHAVYFLPNQYAGKCKLTAYLIDSQNQRIESFIEVQIMEKKNSITTDATKVTGSPRDEPNNKNDTMNVKRETVVIDVVPTQTHAIVPTNTPLAPISENQQEQSTLETQEEIERKYTHLTQTSIEERRKLHSQQAQMQKKSFLLRSKEMTDPTTNQDSWTAMMAYICFATAFTYLEKGDYTIGTLMLVCFLVFAFAKQGLPEGPFTQWLKNRSKVTISEARRTFIGDK